MFPSQPQAQKKSFVQTLQNARNIPISNFSKLYLKGNNLSIKIPKEDTNHDSNIVGIIYMGDRVSLRASELRDKLMKLCSPITNDMNILNFHSNQRRKLNLECQDMDC